MPKSSRKEFIWRSILLVVGALAVLVAAVLAWAEINLPLNVRFPVPSLDGRYFAYFDPVRSGGPEERTPYDLIVFTSEGQPAAEFPQFPGPILWSGAGHIAIVNIKHNLTTLIPNIGGQFLILAGLPLEPGSFPVWSRDGTRLAYLRPSVHGEELAVYNLQQPQSMTVAWPAGTPLKGAWLLFWSPLGDEIYFLNHETDGLALERIQIQTGELKILARDGDAWGTPHFKTPELSPDGSRIYLPAPAEAVIQAQTGETIWKLPEHSTALWSPWSGDGDLIFGRRDLSEQIFAHDFEAQSDRTVLSGFPANGVFSVDGKSYFFRKANPRRSWNFLSPVRDWLEPDWGWRQVDAATSKVEALGRLSLRPWAETQDGLIVGRRDEYSHVRFGLYDPARRDFSSLNLPTARGDRLRQYKFQLPMLVAIGLCGLIGFAASLRRAGGRPARALAALSFLLMLEFSFGAAIASWQNLPDNWVWALPSTLNFEQHGWLTSLDFAWLPLGNLISTLTFVPSSLLLLVLMHFILVFPEGNQFLTERARLRHIAYAVASLPLVLLVATFFRPRSPIFPRPLILTVWLIGAGLAVGVAVAAMLFNHRHPPDRRARHQIPWVTFALSLPLAGITLLNLFAWIAGRVEIGISPFDFLDSPIAITIVVWICLFALALIGYALYARKLTDLRLLLRRAARYSTMAGLVAAVFVLLLAGLGLLAAGSFRNPSDFVIIASILLTAGVLAPLRHRIESFVDRTFARSSYEIRGELEQLAEELPRILDRRILVGRLEETLSRALQSRSIYLFILDRATHRLRPERGHGDLPREIADLEFDPAEPLCSYIAERKRPFEVGVSPYDPKIIPAVRSAADRLARLSAELVFALERRGQLLGLLFVGTKRSEDFFNAEEIGLLSMVAHQTTVAIENTGLLEEVARERALRKEMEIASEVQALLFPASLPRSKSCQIAGRCVPARSISGDYYDFLELPGNKIGLSIGDVAGKGVSASLLMASLQGLLRDQAPTSDSPAELARRINRQLFSSSRGAKHCAFFYAIFDETTRQLEFVNAGHSPPLLINSQFRKLLESTGVPLGLFPEVTHEVRSEALTPDTLVLLYSDGITEARDELGNFYGLDRLVDLVTREHQRSPEDLVDRILEDVRAFLSDEIADDDQTLVVLKVNPR